MRLYDMTMLLSTCDIYWSCDCHVIPQPDGEDGDVIVILQQMDHATFTRKELDLFVKKTVTLKEALCGFKFSFEHLDGRKMCLACSPGEVIAPGELFRPCYIFGLSLRATENWLREGRSTLPIHAV